MMTEMILGEVALGCLYLVTKPSHVGVDVDGLVYPLHRPMTHSYQSRGQGLPTRRRLALSFVVGSGAFRGIGSFPSIDI
jgi:hypothetical protein